MRSVDIDPAATEPKGGGKLGEIGRRLCGCCISKGNKLRPVELTKDARSPLLRDRSFATITLEMLYREALSRTQKLQIFYNFMEENVEEWKERTARDYLFETFPPHFENSWLPENTNTITNQPALSNISVLKKDVFNEHDNGAKLDESEANVAGNGILSKANGDISPLTAKKLKEDCSNVTTVVLDDLIATSGGDDRSKNTQVSVDAQLAYVVEDGNACDVQRIVQESWGTNEKREGKYGRSSLEGKDPVAFTTSTRPSASSSIVDHRPSHAEENHGKVLLWEEKDDITEMEDITNMLFETTSQSNERNALKNSQNTPQKSIRHDSQALTEMLAPQPPLSNQKQTTGIRECTVTGIDSSDNDSDSDSDEEVDSHRRRNSNIAYVELSGAKPDEHLGQHIPTIAIRQATLFSSSLDSESECNRSSENHRPSPFNPRQKSAASMRLNHTEDLESEPGVKVDGPNDSEIRNASPEIGYMADYAQQIRVLADSSGRLKTQNGDCHTYGEMDESKPVSTLQRPTHMYASSSSSSDDEEEVEKDQNVTRISVKSNGDAAIKSTTSNGEVVSVQLACANDHRKFDDTEMFTDDEFPERLI